MTVLRETRRGHLDVIRPRAPKGKPVAPKVEVFEQKAAMLIRDRAVN
jgi:hypothetical protein